MDKTTFIAALRAKIESGELRMGKVGVKRVFFKVPDVNWNVIKLIKKRQF